MSAFLGPVHHWMYGKIQLQEELTANLLTLSADAQLADKLNDAYGRAENRPLEEIIDQSNIHGWLNARVLAAEQRFATAVKTLLEQENIKLESLISQTQAFGRRHKIEKSTDIANVYKAIDSVLLDGMPCDGGRSLISEEADELVFQSDLSLHALCKSDEDAAVFVLLREALLCGILTNSGFEIQQLGGGAFKIKKES